MHLMRLMDFMHLMRMPNGVRFKSLAMSEERDVVAMSAIAERLGKTTGYLSPYRRQLIARQVIEQTAPGYVTFSIPFMREFLQERRGTILARYGE